VAEDYRSVLSQMGYTVISTTSRPAMGSSGQTIITYKPENQSQARLLARHLPGQRVLNSTTENLPAGAVVTIR
jgi:hypothetical protein